MDDDGTVRGQLLEARSNTAPSWSPDGTKIAFSSGNPGDIFVINADNTSLINLTQGPANDISPSWSPDGTKIAFVSDRNGNQEIYIMNANGRDSTRLTTDAAADHSPSWSPDGTKIAFVSDRSGNQEIYVMNADGTGVPSNLTDNPAADHSPSWSPDGTRIAFVSERDGNQEVYVMDAKDGSHQSNLTQNAAADHSPSWAPFRHIGFSADGAPVSRVMTIENRDTTGIPLVGNIAFSRGGFSAIQTHFTVPPGGSQDVNIAFTPTFGGATYATMTITSNDGTTPSIHLTVNGAQGQFKDVTGTLPHGVGGSNWGHYGPDGNLYITSGEGFFWGDYDNDGHTDFIGAGVLNHSNGDGTFSDSTASAGVGGGPLGFGASWGDYNNDGDLDLYAPYSDGSGRLYRNNKDSTNCATTLFTDVTDSFRVDEPDRDPVNGAWGDYDNDGDLDLYVSNNGGPSRLYQNQGDGTFKDVAVSAGISETGAGLGVAWGDYDNDGDLDICQTGWPSNRLYRNEGIVNGVKTGTWNFVEVAASARLDRDVNGTGVAWGDYDNDGDLDLYLAQLEQNRLYENNGNGTFTDVAAKSGVPTYTPTENSASWGDYDGNGSIDLLTAGHLYRNNGTPNRWLVVKLVGTESNRSGIGAKVWAVTGALRQRRDVDGGSGHFSQPSLPVEFGFGSTTTVDSLIICWPSGIEQVLTHVATNQTPFLTVVENRPPVVGAISAPVDPISVNVAVNASGSFTDPDVHDTHTAVWAWGDSSTSPGGVSETNGSGSVTGSHIYTGAGVYTVRLTVTDNNGASDTSVFQSVEAAHKVALMATGSSGTPDATVFPFIVVYDPSAGFVTGGGWINSPAGAYTPNPSLTGKASFGFVSKYQKGADVPTGQTQFNFKVASLTFHSTAYEWLVVAGAHAKYKGSGKINNSGDYGFVLTATDGQVNGGGGVDKFRIKIWNRAGGGVVYDNQMGESDDGDATDAIEGGSIVIHKDGAAKPAVSEQGDGLPEAFSVDPNYPNPFNPSTAIRYALPEASDVGLTIYNVLGQQVRALVQDRQEAGYYRVTWDGRDDYGRAVSSGIYLYRFVSKGLVETRRMLLLK